MKIKIAFALIAVLLAVAFSACQFEDLPEVEVTITFNSDGAGTFDPIIIMSGQTLGEQLPAPNKQGYDFLGWFDGVTMYSENTVIGGVDITLTARWRQKGAVINTVDVTFNAGTGGIPETEIISVLPGKSLGLNFPINPRREGHVFNGWVSGSSPFTASTIVSSATTVTATWTAKSTKFTVTFNVALPAFSSAAPPPIQVFDGDYVDEWGRIFPNDPTPAPFNSEYAEYQFTYWTIDGSGNEIFSNVTPVTANISVTANHRFGLKEPMTAELDLNRFYAPNSGLRWVAMQRPGGASSGAGQQSYNSDTGIYTATFTGDNQGIAFWTPDGTTTAPNQPNIRAGLQYADYVKIVVEGVANPEDYKLRFIIGRNDVGSNWDGSAATSPVPFSEFLATDENGQQIGIESTMGARKTEASCRELVMLQARENGDAPGTTINIKKITIHIR